MNNHYINYNNQYYILASSTVAEQKAVAFKDGNVFSVLDKYGDIKHYGESVNGIYCMGTRFLSHMELLLEHQAPFILSSSLNEENEMHTVDLTNHEILKDHSSILEKGMVHVLRQQFLFEGVFYETIQLCSFSQDPITFHLSISFDADFKDIFEIRGMKRAQTGSCLEPAILHNEITLSYEGLDDIKRSTRINLNPPPASVKDKTAEYILTLIPQQCQFIFIGISFEIGENKPKILNNDEAFTTMVHRMNSMKDSVPYISSTNEQFNQWLDRSKSDMFTIITKLETGYYPYAGIPWFCTPFGRDAIITAIECLWVVPEMAKGVIKYLAKTQALEFNETQDAEPGKIFHEQRGGEMANTGEIPFKMYYGTIDATPLFISLAYLYYERTGDKRTIKEIMPNIEHALEWIDKYGDRDGDLFVEYERRKKTGLENQGWKDSWNAITNKDGTLAEKPIALCEVQAFVYWAKINAAKLFKVLEKPEKADTLEKEASVLQEKFIEHFWSEDKQVYALALDGKKNKCDVVSSNAGLCLMTGIAPQDHATKISKTLFSKKMFTGWGIRTLAKDEKRYNPMSYHNGSVWPHDNALIAYGLCQYGFCEEVNDIMTAMFEVAQRVESFRLPELFCGFDKIKNQGITNYPVACSPQAWATGSIYLLLQACLGLKISAIENTIYFNSPKIPEFLDEIIISNISINSSKISLQIKKSGKAISVFAISEEGPKIKIEISDDAVFSNINIKEKDGKLSV